MTGLLDKKVDMMLLYSGLEQEGISLSDEEKEKLETDIEKWRKNYQTFGSNFGANAQGLIFQLFAFLQNIFRGFQDDGGTSLGDSFGTAGKQGDLFALNQMTCQLYDDMTQDPVKYPNLAKAAEYVTGQGQHGQPQNMQTSVYNQYRKDIDLPWGTKTSLNTEENGYEATVPNVRRLRPLVLGIAD